MIAASAETAIRYLFAHLAGRYLLTNLKRERGGIVIHFEVLECS